MIQAKEFFTTGISMFHHLSWDQCHILLEELEKHPLKKALPLNENEVTQDFDEADLLVHEFPKTIARLREVECVLRENYIQAESHHFNRFHIKRYLQGSTGISPHRDGERYLNPIAISVLKDGGDFCIYKNMEDKRPMILPAGVGDVIVINTDIVHCVRKVRQDRYTITQQHDTKLYASM